MGLIKREIIIEGRPLTGIVESLMNDYPKKSAWDIYVLISRMPGAQKVTSGNVSYRFKKIQKNRQAVKAGPNQYNVRPSDRQNNRRYETNWLHSMSAEDDKKRDH